MDKTSGMFSRLPEEIPQSDAERAFEMLSGFGREKELTKQDKAKADTMKELALAEITKKYDFYEKLFAAVFAERRAITEGFFRIIDQGIREKNNDLVLAGLSSLSNMVASSPLTNLGSLNTEK
jgi:hypothetical protein